MHSTLEPKSLEYEINQSNYKFKNRFLLTKTITFASFILSVNYNTLKCTNAMNSRGIHGVNFRQKTIKWLVNGH